nr:MurR/RpiR family transcriptional regulator [uncultured Caproiciproducens sp.]
MPNDTFGNINKNYHNLTRKQKDILDFLMLNPEDVCYISLKDLSKRTMASEVTILRMCKRLGFDSFIDMKKAFRIHTERLVKNFLETSYFSLDMPISNQSDKKGAMEQICQTASQQGNEFYSTVQPDEILKAARQILQAKTVLICGEGVSAIVADFFYRRISPLIPNAILVHPEDMDNVQANLVKLRPGDHMIAISFPRYYSPMQNIVQYAEYKGATVTSITDSINSPVVTQKSLNFLCKTSTKVFYNSFSLPIELVNLIASGIVLEMGTRYDELVADAHEVIHFINEAESNRKL